MIPIFCVACQCLFTASPLRNLIFFTVIFMSSSGCTQLVRTKLKQVQSLLLHVLFTEIDLELRYVDENNDAFILSISRTLWLAVDEISS
jgi:hypothetical protein